jgi:hypothetical protein
LNLPAREFHKECLDPAPRQHLHHAFSGAWLLEFNIHYHRGNDVRCPVQLKKMRVLPAKN